TRPAGASRSRICAIGGACAPRPAVCRQRASPSPANSARSSRSLRLRSQKPDLSTIAFRLLASGFWSLFRADPAFGGEMLLRLEAVFVAHLARAIDPIAEIDEGKPEAPRELDLIEDHIGAETARGQIGIVE